MEINIARYHGRERLEMECEIVTPMFLGNSRQEAELRAAPFKGVIRYWWRIAFGRKHATHQELLSREKRIFGSDDEKSGGKSRITVSVAQITEMQPLTHGFGDIRKVAHPECENTGRQTNPLAYLAGMGLIHYRKGIQHSYFQAGEQFSLIVETTGDVAEEVRTALDFLSSFAAIGSRSRNGWGSLAIRDVHLDNPELVDWQQAMDRDYPHCLGRDEQGALLWMTRNIHDDWKQCMRSLAEVYISVRTVLNVNAGNPPDRHLLGYPVTNHPVMGNHWGRQGRHASALRLLVRKEGDRFRGYFLHLPHAFSNRMWPGDLQRQVDIWQKVHETLDTLCTRVPTGEVQ